jgi:asparagine synthase (glutamine-hydrolysing)
MCGIAGLVDARPQPPLVDRMLALLAHRGPDAVGRWAGDGAVLGARRLAIVDVAGGHQPVVTPDDTVVAVLNGEIYNHAELRATLHRRGHRLANGSDTECLIHLYEEYGTDLVRH